MTYLQKNNRTKRRGYMNIVYGVVAVLIVIELIFHPFKGILSFVTRPLEGVRQGLFLGMEGVGAFFTSKPRLQEDNRLLKEEIQSLQRELQRSSLYQQENNSLRELLGVKEESPNNIVAQVIAHPPATVYDTLLVRFGEQQNNIFVGMPVFYGSMYIGTVESIEADNALIRLATSDTLTQEVYVNEETILLTGKGGGTFEVTVPKGFEIAKGQILSHVRYPTQPFVIVEHIEADDVQAVQKVFLRAMFPLHSIRYVNF